MDTITYVGLDVHKATVSLALAEGGRGGELRQLGSLREPSRASNELAENRDGFQPLRPAPIPPFWPRKFPVCPLMLQKWAVR